MSESSFPPAPATCGGWASPISAAAIVARGIELGRGSGQIRLDGEDVYWVEGRPHQKSRHAVVRATARGETEDSFPIPFSARTRVHEYGGGDFIVHQGSVFFANEADQRLFRCDRFRRPVPITPPGSWRYADPEVDIRRRRLICVREDHSSLGGEPIASLVAVEMSGHTPPRVLVSGADFYSSPRFSPDGTRLAWLSWNHPNMPWDGTELWLATVTPEGNVVEAKKIAGGADESILQPQWSPAGFLYFLSDRSGWWNLYRLVGDEVQSVCPYTADFAAPPWSLGESTYGFASEKQIIGAFVVDGAWQLASIAAERGELTPLRTLYSEIGNLRVRGSLVFFRGATPQSSHEIVRFDLNRRAPVALRHSEMPGIEDGYFSTAQPLHYASAGGATAHAFYYPPTNPKFVPRDGEKPPLIVISHGGPTASASRALDLKIQFWTSRGFALLDVNYRGSSGYGRAYRRLLDGQWGVADVEDCIFGARHLADLGLVDSERMAIRGSSAGGYTCLRALTTSKVFRAGASYYGISDLEGLAKDTHKFESRYTDRLVGPYPQRRDLYRQRSPLHFVDDLSCPLIVFQGLDDKVVPPAQAEVMVAAVRAKGLPVAYITFAGEGHGFRQPANSQRALEAELYFYSRCFGFPVADAIEPVEIENL